MSGPALEVRERSARYLLRAEPALIPAFDLLTTAQDGVARLRQAIMSLAVRGRLIPQSNTDEPADNLLKRATERAVKPHELAAARRFRKTAPIHGSELPFDLPRGWAWARLPEVTHDWGQKTPASQFTYIDVAGVDNTRCCIAEPAQVLNAADAPSRARKIVKRGSVIYSTVRPYLKNIAVVDRDYEPEPIARTAFVVMHPMEGVSAEFLVCYLRSDSFTEFVASKMVGVAYPAINDSNFFEGVMPVPPAAEQLRIVARVEELLKLCDALEQSGRLADEQHARLTSTLCDALAASESAHALAENWQRIAEHFDLLLDRSEAIDALEQTISQLAVRGALVRQDALETTGEDLLKRCILASGVSGRRVRAVQAPPSEEEVPFSVPTGWVWARFGDVADVSGGVTLGRKGTPAQPMCLPYLRVANVQRGKLNLIAEVKNVTVDASEVSRFQLRSGDLLIAEGGDWDKVGRTCIWREEISGCLHQNHIFKARGWTPEWLPAWGELFLNSADARSYFAASAKQTTNLASINMTELRYLAFPLPPLAEQHRIVARVEELRRLCYQLRERLTEARRTQSQLAEALVQQVTNAPNPSVG